MVEIPVSPVEVGPAAADVTPKKKQFFFEKKNQKTFVC
jgi:hypothetical protein